MGKFRRKFPLCRSGVVATDVQRYKSRREKTVKIVINAALNNKDDGTPEYENRR
jgi:hypothetical protein